MCHCLECQRRTGSPFSVAVGAFADPTFPRPEQSVWTKDKHAWLGLPEDVATFESSPPPRGRAVGRDRSA